MAVYKKISREPIKVVGYMPRFNTEVVNEELPEKVESPIIESLPTDNSVYTPTTEEEVDTVPQQETNEEVKEEIPLYTGTKFDAFKIAYKNAEADPNKFKFFAKLAKKESGFDPKIQNKLGAPAYGYFQFMQGTVNGRSWDNISRFANSDIETFRNSPELQIKAAQKLADAFLKGFTKEDYKKARELGYSDSALLAGAWLGGVGGVRKLLHKGISVDDKSWSNGKNIGTDMQTRMKEFNNLFKRGGILKFQAGGTGEIKPDNRSWLTKKIDNIATKYNSSQWAKSAPAAVLAGFTPYGLWHYSMNGDNDSARLAILPGTAGIVGDKIIKSKAGTKLKDPKAVGEISSQETIKWMQDKNGEVSYARRHKHNYPEFWGRLTQLNKESIPDWEDPRSHATHKLSWGTNEDKVIVYPEVQKINGKLIDFSRPPYHQFAGMDNALETGNYVEAPSEDVADNFTKTYKQNYKGFPDHDIFSNEADRKTFHLRSDKANYLYKKLLDAGYNNIQASAIIGSAFVEGQLLENAREKGNSRRGYGIMQWTNPTRLQNLKNFKSKTANNEFKRQVDFLIHELKDNSVWNSKGSTLQQFLNAQDIDTATILFAKGYLNPKTGLEHFDRRKEVARYYNDNTPDYNFNIF